MRSWREEFDSPIVHLVGILMNRIKAEEIVTNLGEDERLDLLMHLAEDFDYQIIDYNGRDVTFFLSTGETL